MENLNNQSGIKKVRKELKECHPEEVLDFATELGLSKGRDQLFLHIMTVYRELRREYFCREVLEVGCPDVKIKIIDHAYQFITEEYGVATYYPQGDRLHLSKQRSWLESSGINFLKKNVLYKMNK